MGHQANFGSQFEIIFAGFDYDFFQDLTFWLVNINFWWQRYLTKSIPLFHAEKLDTCGEKINQNKMSGINPDFLMPWPHFFLSLRMRWDFLFSLRKRWDFFLVFKKKSFFSLRMRCDFLFSLRKRWEFFRVTSDLHVFPEHSSNFLDLETRLCPHPLSPRELERR